MTQRLVELGKAEAKNGRGKQAVETFHSALAVDPNCFEANVWLSMLLRQQGDFQESIGYAETAVRLHPSEANTYSNLGLSFMGVQDFVRAAESFEKAASLNPKIAPNFHQLGIAFQMQGRDDEAIEALRRANSLAPNNADTLFALARSLLNRLNSEHAIECATKVLKLNPKSAAAHLLLASAYIAENRTAEAEEEVRLAVELDPQDSNAHAMLGMRLQGLGRLAEADASFRRSIDVEPSQGFAYCALVRNHKVRDADLDMIRKMEELTADSTIPPRGQSFLHFGLGKAYEDLADYGRAMRHFDEANRISYRLRFGERKFDKRKYSDQIDWSIKTFTPEFFEANRAASSASEVPILIVGMMRSGTTLAEQILSSHPDVEARGEQQFWMRRGGEAWNPATGTLSAAVLKSLGADYLSTLQSHAPPAEHFTDKMPDNYLALGLIQLAFPNAKIIHTRRNPIDTCISIYTTPNRTSDEYANSRQNIVYAYQEYQRLMDHWRKVIPCDRLFEVNYEELVAEQERLTREMVAFCGLEWDEACLRPEDNDRTVTTPSVWQVRQPVYSTSIERWRNYEPYLGVFESLRGPLSHLVR